MVRPPLEAEFNTTVDAPWTTLLRLGAMDVTKPYEFIGFGAMDVTKPYKFIWFGDIHGPKPSEFIGFGAMELVSFQ